ncbi:MAG: ABC transporter substrate-binding protein [Nitrospinae bacterium]|nr:ABC transporter substrate-binding protein [Nitrospinota bacterium]
MAGANVSENRLKREEQFQKDVKNPRNTPVVQSGATVEKAAPQYDFEKKNEADVRREPERKTKIAVLGPFTGELDFYGKDASDGAEMASDEINDRGGIKKQKYDLLVYDTKGSMDGARAGVKKFIDEKVAAIVGAATGEVSFSATKTLNDNQLILVSAGSRRRLGDSGPYNFRVTLDDNHGIKRLVEYVVKEKKWRNFALFTSLVNDFSIKLTAAFKGEIEKQKANVAQELYLWSAQMSNMQKEETSIPAQISKLKTNTPDALIYTGDGKEGAELVSEMRKQGINIPVIGCEDLMVPEFVSLGKAAEGTVVYGGFNVNSSDPRVRKFVADYKKRYNRPPTRLSALAYDAYYMVAEAIEKAPSLRPTHLRDSLMAIKDFHGVTGVITVGPNREAVKEPFIFEFAKKDSKYDFYSTREPL